MKRAIYIALISFLTWHQSFSQTFPGTAASSFAQSVTTPTHPLTGKPLVNKFLFEIGEGNLAFPLWLLYQGGGIRAGQPASDVGLGWGLNIPIIVKSTQHLHDDDFTKGYFEHGNNVDYNQVINNGFDGMPDIFSYSIPGHQGRFVFDDAQNIHLIPRITDLRITVEVGTTHNDREFKGFTITDSHGTQYHFGRIPGDNVHAREYQDSSSSPSHPNAWFLLKIETYDKEHSLTFHYLTNRYQMQHIDPYQYVIEGNNVSSTAINGGNQLVSGTQIRYRTIDVHSKILQRIEATHETLVFTHTSRSDVGNNNGTYSPKAISGVQWESGNGNDVQCVRYDFTQSYFTDGTGLNHSWRKRLKLDQVQKISCLPGNSDSEPPCTFTYYGGNTMIGRLSYAIDDWGFYNNQGNNNTSANLVQSGSTYKLYGGSTITFGAADRIPDLASTLQGSLQRMTLSTGGYIEYDYEMHRAIDPHDEDNYTQLWTATTNEADVCDVDDFDVHTTQINLSATMIETGVVLVSATNLKDNCGPTPDMNVRFIIRQGGMQVYSMSSNFSEVGDWEPLYLKDMGLSTGLTEFEFAAEEEGVADIFVRYIPQVGPGDEVGGLRIKQIKEHDGISSGNDIIRNFEYMREGGTGNNSSGRYAGEPYYIGLLVPEIPSGPGARPAFTLADPHSIRPLSSFEGQHIYYERVVEKQPGNGEIVYEFDVEDFSESQLVYPSYPASPQQPMVKTGSSKATTLWAENAASDYDQQTTFELRDDNYYNIAGNKLAPFSSSVCSGQGCNKVTVYHVRSRLPIRYTATTTDKFGVVTTQTMTYDASPTLPKHLGPKTQEVINSDGLVHKITLDYTPYHPDSDVEFVLSQFNVIQPYKMVRSAGGADLSGTERTFAFYPENGGIADPDGTGDIYVHKIRRLETTYENSMLIGGWRDVTTITHRDNKGFPDKVQDQFWVVRDFDYYDGLVEKVTFSGFEQENTFIPGTRLLQQKTDVDGSYRIFAYDGLTRTSEITDYCLAGQEEVATIYDYLIEAPQGGQPKTVLTTTTDYTHVPGSDLDIIIDKSYRDGLNREVLHVRQNASEDNQDIATRSRYDNQGRRWRTYEPVKTGTNTGAFFAVPDASHHTEVLYRPSPRNLVASTTAPDWPYPRTIDYQAVAANTVENFHTIGTYYAEGSLLQVTNTDENGNKQISFIDKIGQEVLDRQEGASTGVRDLYLVYDPKSRIRLVRPEGFAAAAFYQIIYDVRDNVIKKYGPNGAPIYIRYNQRGLPALYQDGNLRAQNKWLATNYDTYGRATESGFYGTGETNLGFGNLTITSGDLLGERIYGTATQEIDKLKTLRLRVLGTSNWIESTDNFDLCGRPQSSSGNSIVALSAGSESYDYEWDHADNLLELSHDHGGPANLVLDYFHTFDKRGRPQVTDIKVGTNPLKRLYNYDWNHKEELIQNALGTNSDQLVNYTYKPNGLLEKINEKDSPSDMFYEELYYENSLGLTSNPTNKNGNITNVIWQTQGNLRQAYELKYDFLDRLLNADHAEINSSGNPTSNQDEYNTSYGYDLRGNLTTLSREGKYLAGGTYLQDEIDNLTFQYVNTTQSDKIMSISDNGMFGEGYTEGTGNYTYDGNGNTLYDPSRDVTYTYNHLDLPTSATFGDGRKIEWVYDAAGSVLEQRLVVGSTVLELRQYVGNIQYVNGEIESIYHAHGRVYNQEVGGLERVTGLLNTTDTYHSNSIVTDATISSQGDITLKAEECIDMEPGFEVVSGGEYTAEIAPYTPGTPDWQYQFFIQDHLGNVRAVFSGNTLLSECHFYPHGLEMKGPWLQDGEQRYGYNGMEHVDEFGLDMNMTTYRMHDPASARWLQVDPVDHLAGTGYGTMNGDPMSYLDPDGDVGVLAAIGITFASSVLINEAAKALNSAGVPTYMGSGTGISFYRHAGGGYGTNPAPMFRDWYIDEETGEYVWFPGNEERPGYRYHGPFAIIEGDEQFLVHHQNQLVRAIDKGSLEILNYYSNGMPRPTNPGLQSMINFENATMFAGGWSIKALSFVRLGGRFGPKATSSVFSYITPKISKQMTSRGWTKELLHKTVNNPHTTRPAKNRATGNAATAYFRKSGSYVVRDNATGQVVQISNRFDRNWIPDASIINPYIPK